MLVAVCWPVSHHLRASLLKISAQQWSIIRGPPAACLNKPQAAVHVMNGFIDDAEPMPRQVLCSGRALTGKLTSMAMLIG